MTRPPKHTLTHLGVATLSLVMMSSCSAPPPAGKAGQHLISDITPNRSGQIRQLDFGRSASFATCMPPACLKRTPKTLASEAPTAMAGLRPSDFATSLQTGEVPVAAEVRPRYGPAPLVPTQAASGTTVSRQVTVLFGFDSAALTPTARSRIDQAAGMPGIQRIAIRGRTDDIGRSEVNETLARTRAHAVRDHLRTPHPQLTSAEVTLDAKGGCCFAAPNDTPQGRAQNRRAEVVFERGSRDLCGVPVADPHVAKTHLPTPCLLRPNPPITTQPQIHSRRSS